MLSTIRFSSIINSFYRFDWSNYIGLLIFLKETRAEWSNYLHWATYLFWLIKLHWATYLFWKKARAKIPVHGVLFVPSQDPDWYCPSEHVRHAVSFDLHANCIDSPINLHANVLVFFFFFVNVHFLRQSCHRSLSKFFARLSLLSSVLCIAFLLCPLLLFFPFPCFALLVPWLAGWLAAVHADQVDAR